MPPPQRTTASMSASRPPDSNLNPNSVTTELANRDTAFTTCCSNGTGNYVQVRGFNMLYGGVALLGIGDLAEGNDVFGGGNAVINNDAVSATQTSNFTYSGSGNYIGGFGSLVEADALAGDAVLFPSGETLPSPLSPESRIISAIKAAAHGNCSLRRLLQRPQPIRSDCQARRYRAKP